MADVNQATDAFMDYGDFEIGNIASVIEDGFSDEELNTLLAQITETDFTLQSTSSPDEILGRPNEPDQTKSDLENLVVKDDNSAPLDDKKPRRSERVDEADLDQIYLDERPKNTLKTTNWGVSIFKQWLTQQNGNQNFESLPAKELAKLLRHFYAEVRTIDGQYYSKSSYVGIRAAIHRHLRAPPHERNFNLLQDQLFHSANNVFHCILRKIKKMGLDNPKHHEAIFQGDIAKIRSHLSVDTPENLQVKVWFDLTLGFGRRGCESQRSLTRDSFTVETDDMGLPFITMTHSEATKNHPGGVHDKGQGKPRIYATGLSSCPVDSFLKYKSKLNPQNPALFQQPRKSVTAFDTTWYTLKPLGHNTLSTMMKTLSVNAGLSQIYTNHCVRATTVTLLAHAGVESREIVKLTGHKNQQSLDSYNTDSSSDQKRTYSSILQGTLGNSTHMAQSVSPNSMNQVNMAQSVKSCASSTFQITNCAVTVINNHYGGK